MANDNAIHLKICASAGFDIFRSEPLPQLDQSQAFSLIDVKHSLVTRQTERERGREGGMAGVSIKDNVVWSPSTK